MKGISSMKSPLVTVVLPIYNVEKYLNRCIRSVVNQSYNNLEIILVDDGSTDNSGFLCDEWKQKDNRIKVIHKENAGLGEARNTGIDNATGQYICFFDSDDYIRLDAIDCAISSIQANNSEIAIWGWGGVNQEGKLYLTCIPQVEKKHYDGDEVQSYFLPNLISHDPETGIDCSLQMSAWSMMYSMNLIKETHWRFASERKIISEDVYSLLNLFSDVKSVSVISDYLYFYCINNNSLTKSYRPDRYKRIKDFYLDSIRLCEEKNYSNEIRRRITGPYLSFTIAALKQESIRKPFGNVQIRQIINDELFCDLICKKYKQNILRKIFFGAAKRKYMILCELLLTFQTRH